MTVKTYKVIMAPVDASPLETPALTAAATLARQLDATLHLVRVLAPPIAAQSVQQINPVDITEEDLAKELEAYRANLEALGAEVELHSEVRVHTTLKVGRVTQTLRDHADEIGADIIVMSSHSHAGLKRLNLGSVTDYLIRNTHIPVLVVKPDIPLIDEAPETTARFVVPLDGSAMAEQILPEVATLATALKASVTLLHVLTPQTPAEKRIAYWGLPWNADVAAAEAYLAGPANLLTANGLTVTKKVVLNADVPFAILDYSIRNRANCIAVATNGVGGLRRFVFGTVADEVTRKSPISLLVFHPNLQAQPEISA
jgi:nucleotide-binding universal stress UspA family protein